MAHTRVPPLFGVVAPGGLEAVEPAPAAAAVGAGAVATAVGPGALVAGVGAAGLAVVGAAAGADVGAGTPGAAGAVHAVSKLAPAPATAQARTARRLTFGPFMSDSFHSGRRQPPAHANAL